MSEPLESFKSSLPWMRHRPRTLVVACSDGRLQVNLDEFLQRRLAVIHYDRLYAPGGPGALASSGIKFLRSDVYQREARFLIEAHEIEEVVLLFHGPAEAGPVEALCADYRRIFPNWDAGRIRAQQDEDLAEIHRKGFGWNRSVHLKAFRAEIEADDAVRFAEMPL